MIVHLVLASEGDGFYNDYAEWAVVIYADAALAAEHAAKAAARAEEITVENRAAWAAWRATDPIPERDANVYDARNGSRYVVVAIELREALPT